MNSNDIFQKHRFLPKILITAVFYNLKISYIMPKVKTNSSAKKRFKVTGGGKITFQKAFKRHILTKKSTKRKRNMRKDGVVADANLHFVKRLLCMK